MPYRKEMEEFNERFVENKDYKRYLTTKYPERKIAILTCMDTRLIELLPAALNLKNGDAKIIKNAGGVISHPFGSAIRSLMKCVYELGVEEIFVIGHHDCGMHNTDTVSLISKMKARGIREADLELIEYFNINLEEWLKGFEDSAASVRDTVSMIKKHPLLPHEVTCTGYLMDPTTGKLERVAE